MTHHDILLIVPGYSSICEESLGLGYIASAARCAGYTVEIMDRIASGEDREEFSRNIARNAGGKILGITIMAGSWLEDLHYIFTCLDREDVHPIHTVVGGIVPSLVPSRVLDMLPGIDSLICYEGEKPFLELIRTLQSGEKQDSMTAMNGRKGRMILPLHQEFLTDLDSLSFPARDTLPQVIKRGGPALIQGSRGCRGECSFCSQHYLNHMSTGGLWRGRSPHNMVSEIKTLLAQYRIPYLKFVDENFFGGGTHSREKELAGLMKSEGITIPFRISARADEIDEETLEQLQEVGLDCIHLGIEAGVQNVLTRYNKKTTHQLNRKALRIITHMGLNLAMGFIMFSPETTLVEIRETIAFLREESVGFNLIPGGILSRLLSCLEVYYGTPLFDRYQEEGLLKRNEWEPHRFKFVFRDERVNLFYIGLFGVTGPVEKAFRRLESLEGPLVSEAIEELNLRSLNWAEQLLDFVEKEKVKKREDLNDYLKGLYSEMESCCRNLLFRILAKNRLREVEEHELQ